MARKKRYVEPDLYREEPSRLWHVEQVRFTTQCDVCHHPIYSRHDHYARNTGDMVGGKYYNMQRWHLEHGDPEKADVEAQA